MCLTTLPLPHDMIEREKDGSPVRKIPNMTMTGDLVVYIQKITNIVSRPGHLAFLNISTNTNPFCVNILFDAEVASNEDDHPPWEVAST